MRRRALLRCVEDRRGNTIVEFALIAPAMIMMLMVGGDLLYRSYVQSILDGALEKAGRDSGIQGGAESVDVIDAKVLDMVKRVAPNLTRACPATGSGTWCSERKSYSNFSAMKPEPFTDRKRKGVYNNVYDPDECFTDTNGNKTWDADPSRAGQGGASDVTLYSMTVTYPRLFPVSGFFGFAGWGKQQTITSQTLLKNQPYANQIVNAPVPICP